MSLPRLIRTTSFRLAATYLVVFSFSVTLLGCFLYFSIGREMIAQIDDRLGEESARLKADFAKNGLDRLADDIRVRMSAAGALDYRLEDKTGHLLAGGLPAADAGRYDEGWTKLVKVEEEGGETDRDWERALVTRLGDGAVLVVGDELDGVEEARRAVLVAFGWAVAATMVVGAGGGLLLSAAFLRRIDQITKTAQEIIAGDLSRRIPLTKGDADLARLARTFNAMLDRIGALIDANKHVSSAIAHDLRSPLARVLRRLEAARLGPPDASEYEKAVEDAASDIDGVLETFGALLRIGQIETGARRAGFKTLDLAAVALEVAEAFQPAAADEGKTLAFELDEKLPMAGDRELLAQLTANLIDNSIRHTPRGSRIEVRSRHGESGGQLIVADNGPGVPSAERHCIFERFYRVDAARATPGSGLGLSLVAAIVCLHDAKICALDNQPGLKIVIDLPAAA